MKNWLRRFRWPTQNSRSKRLAESTRQLGWVRKVRKFGNLRKNQSFWRKNFQVPSIINRRSFEEIWCILKGGKKMYGEDFWIPEENEKFQPCKEPQKTWMSAPQTCGRSACCFGSSTREKCPTLISHRWSVEWRWEFDCLYEKSNTHNFTMKFVLDSEVIKKSNKFLFRLYSLEVVEFTLDFWQGHPPFRLY